MNICIKMYVITYFNTFNVDYSYDIFRPLIANLHDMKNKYYFNPLTIIADVQTLDINYGLTI